MRESEKRCAYLGELHMRTPTGTKYNYFGPGTKLDERLPSSDPKRREPINSLDVICQKHDIDYSNAESLSDKHEADRLIIKRMDEIPYIKRPWGTTAVQALMKSKVRLGLGKKLKNGRGRRVKNPGRRN